MLEPKTFVLTADHVKLLRCACVRWDDTETGAPAIDPKRPYGNRGVASDVAEILGKAAAVCPHCHEPLEKSNGDAMLAIHRETATALQIVLSTGKFEPGHYTNTAWREWTRDIEPLQAYN